MVEIDLVRRVRDPEFLLQPRAAAKRNASAADHGVTADVVVLLDHEHGRAAVASHDRRAQPGTSRSGDDDIGSAIPFRHTLGGDVGFLNVPGVHCGEWAVV